MEYVIVAALVLVACFFIYKQRGKKSFRDTQYYKITHNEYWQTKSDKGRYGEYLIYKQLESLEKDGAQFLFNCYMPSGTHGITEVDVIMVHTSGIYVFESKNYAGWIFGDERDRQWTQSLVSKDRTKIKNYFFNPLKQNRIHIRALRAIIGYDKRPIYSVVVFTDRSVLKNVNYTDRYARVVTQDDLLLAVRGLKRRSENVLTAEEVSNIKSALYPYTQVSDSVKQAHVENIKAHLERKREQGRLPVARRMGPRKKFKPVKCFTSPYYKRSSSFDVRRRNKNSACRQYYGACF